MLAEAEPLYHDTTVKMNPAVFLANALAAFALNLVNSPHTLPAPPMRVLLPHVQNLPCQLAYVIGFEPAWTSLFGTLEIFRSGIA